VIPYGSASEIAREKAVVKNTPSIAKYSGMFGAPIILGARLGPLHLIVATLCLLLGSCLNPGQQRTARCDTRTPVNETRILESMAERRLELATTFRGYRAVRTFQAENKRFNKKAVMVVETTVQKGHYSASRLISFEGSELIRSNWGVTVALISILRGEEIAIILLVTEH